MKYLNKSKLNHDIMEELQKDLALANIAGAAVMVSQDGEKVCDIRAGVKNVDTGEPLQPGTLFRYASLTKPITGAATLIGVQNGWFDLEDKVSDYFPDFEEMYLGKVVDGRIVAGEKARNPLRLFHLLSHSSGLLCGELGGLQQQQMPESAFTSCKDNVEYCGKHVLLTFEPGEGAAYSAYTAFDVIACLLEQKSGLGYQAFLDKYLFGPLGIRDITFHPTKEQWQRMSAMHDRAEGNRMITVNMGQYIFERFPLSYTCAGAGLCGTIEDYHIFAEMLLEDGTYRGVQILRPEIAALLHKEYVKPGVPGLGVSSNWGIGVRVITEHPWLTRGTFGWSGAYGGHMFIDPEHRITAIYMKQNRWHESHGGGRTGTEFEKIVMGALQ